MDATADSATCEANRKHVVEEKCAGTLRATRPCSENPCDCAVIKLAKAHSRHAVFSGVLLAAEKHVQKTAEK